MNIGVTHGFVIMIWITYRNGGPMDIEEPSKKQNGANSNSKRTRG